MLGHLTSAKHRAWHIPTTSGWAPVCSVQTGELQTSSHNLPVSNGCSCCAWMWFTPQRSLGAARAPLHEPCPLCLASFALCVSSLPLHTPPAQPRQSPYFSVCLHQPSSFPGRWRSTVLTPPNLQVFPALFISISLRLKHQPPPPPPSSCHLPIFRRQKTATPTPRSQLLLFGLKSLPSCLAGLKACTLEGASQLSLATLLQTDRHR